MSEMDNNSVLTYFGELEIRRFRHNSRRFKTGSYYKMVIPAEGGGVKDIIIQVLERVEHDPVNRCGKIKVKQVSHDGVSSNLTDQIIPFEEHFTKSYRDKDGNKEYLLACESINYTVSPHENRLINSCDVCLDPSKGANTVMNSLLSDPFSEPHGGARVRFEVGQKYCAKKEWFEVVSRTTKRITIKAADGDTGEYEKSVVDKFGSKVEVINVKGCTLLSSSNKGDHDNNNNGFINEVEFSTMTCRRQLKLLNDLAEQKREAEEELKLLKEKIATPSEVPPKEEDITEDSYVTLAEDVIFKVTKVNKTHGYYYLENEEIGVIEATLDHIGHTVPSLQIPPKGTKRKDPDGATNRSQPKRPKPGFIYAPEKELADKNRTGSNPHGHKSDMMKSGIAGENKGNQQMSQYFPQYVAYIMACIQNNKQTIDCMKQDGSSWTNEEVVELMFLTFTKLHGSFKVITPTYNKSKPDELLLILEYIPDKRNILLGFYVPRAKERVYAIAKAAENLVRGDDGYEKVYGSTDAFTVGQEGKLKEFKIFNASDDQLFVIIKVEEDNLQVKKKDDESGQYWNVPANYFIKNPTGSNPHDHKSDMMKVAGVAGENKGNQQMSWFANWHYPSERIQFLLATFRGIIEGSHSDIQDGFIIDITTDPLTDEEVTHLLISVSFSCLNEILTPINSNDFRTVPNSNFLIVVSKSRASQKQVLIKFNVTDASNRVTTLKEMYDGALLIKEIEFEQSMINTHYYGNTDTP